MREDGHGSDVRRWLTQRCIEVVGQQIWNSVILYSARANVPSLSFVLSLVNTIVRGVYLILTICYQSIIFPFHLFANLRADANQQSLSVIYHVLYSRAAGKKRRWLWSPLVRFLGCLWSLASSQTDPIYFSRPRKQACGNSWLQINFQETSQTFCIDRWYRPTMWSHCWARSTTGFEVVEQPHGWSSAVMWNYFQRILTNYNHLLSYQRI